MRRAVGAIQQSERHAQRRARLTERLAAATATEFTSSRAQDDSGATRSRGYWQGGGCADQSNPISGGRESPLSLPPSLSP